jgi:uncharacterized OB-fold protein
MPVPVHEGLFTLEPPHLIGGRCEDCGQYQFPRLTTCPYCSGDRVTEALLSERGTLWGWTAVTAAPPGFHGDVPFGFGVVELPEGLRVITRLSHPVDDFTFGMPMQLRLATLHTNDEGEDVVTYEFTPRRVTVHHGGGRR